MALVVAANWDICLGFAGLSLGRYILSATSDSADEAPEAIDHVGLKVFGHLYEYGDLGILTTPLEILDSENSEEAPLKSKYPAFTLRSVEELGTTDKTQEEFEEWVKVMNEGDFQGSNYDVVNCSCVCWGRSAANFLQVPYPANWDKVISWAERNKSFTSLVGSAGLGARHLQHKIADQPNKIKGKVRRLYRKIRRKRDTSQMNDCQEDDGDDDDDDETDESHSNDSSNSDEDEKDQLEENKEDLKVEEN